VKKFYGDNFILDAGGKINGIVNIVIVDWRNYGARPD
jgi:hypothetical protein